MESTAQKTVIWCFRLDFSFKETDHGQLGEADPCALKQDDCCSFGFMWSHLQVLQPDSGTFFC